jgi:modulator of FtsH protease HflK
MDHYGAGLHIQTVNLQQAQPPEQVQPAFEDAIMAREDRERLINEAHAVRNELIPAARGDAARIEEEAAAYAFRVVQGARGDTARFNAVYNEYRNAPDVTRTRLYLDTMERVLSRTGKVMLAGDGDGTNLIYLPLAGLLGRHGPPIAFEEEFGIEMPRGVSGAAEREMPGTSLRGDRHRATREAGR